LQVADEVQTPRYYETAPAGFSMTMRPLPASTFLYAAAVILLITWPFWGGSEGIYCRVMAMAFFYGALAYAWNLYSLTGCISLGHAAFFGLGAYGSGLASHYLGISPYWTVWIGGFLGALYGILWSVLFRKLRGARLGLATLASVEIPKVIVDNWDSFTFGSLGLVGIASLPGLNFAGLTVAFKDNFRTQYYLLLCTLTAIGMIHWLFIQSRWGWAARAVREEETAASMLGVNVAWTRGCALALSAFLTGVCGGVYAHLIGLIEPSMVFSLHISALPLVLSIFGGRYQTLGPVLGALILYPLDQLVFRSIFPVGHAFLYGLVIITTLIFFPNGVAGWLQQRVKIS